MWIDQDFVSKRWTIWWETGPGGADPLYKDLWFNTKEECEKWCRDHKIKVDPNPYA